MGDILVNKAVAMQHTLALRKNIKKIILSAFCPTFSNTFLKVIYLTSLLVFLFSVWQLEALLTLAARGVLEGSYCNYCKKEANLPILSPVYSDSDTFSTFFLTAIAELSSAFSQMQTAANNLNTERRKD
jgi:hypothetical protein